MWVRTKSRVQRWKAQLLSGILCHTAPGDTWCPLHILLWLKKFKLNWGSPVATEERIWGELDIQEGWGHQMGRHQMTLKAQEFYSQWYWAIKRLKWGKKKVLIMMKTEKFPEYFCSGIGNSQMMESQPGWWRGAGAQQLILDSHSSNCTQEFSKSILRRSLEQKCFIFYFFFTWFGWFWMMRTGLKS